MKPFPRSLFLFVILASTVKCATAADTPSFQLVGFATIEANGDKGVTGGTGGQVIGVRTAEELRDALERTDIKKKAQRESAPRIVRIDTDIDLGPLNNDKPGNEIKSVGVVQVRSNTTVYAAGAGATLRHGTLEVHGAHNVIIRNLKFRDLWENDPTGEYDKMGWDYVRISNSGQTRSHHVWVDHCDFEKVYDGMLDIVHGSDLVTVSWCRFAGDKRGPQKKVSLIGHSSGPSAGGVDKGRLNVTMHHNWFSNINDRAPRARFGNIHVFNNFIDGAENATLSVMGAVTLVDNCFYRDCRIATTFSHAKDTVAKDHAGTIVIVNSRNEEPRAPIPNDKDREQFEIEHNFKSSVDPAKFQFNPPADWKWPDLHQLPYTYKADPVETVPELVKKFTGVGKVADADLLKTGP